MIIDIDQLKADRAAGTQGPLCGRVAINGSPSETIANRNRVARLDDLEAGYIAQAERIAELENILSEGGMWVTETTLADLTPRRDIFAVPYGGRFRGVENPRHTRLTLGVEWYGESFPPFVQMVMDFLKARSK